MIQFTVPLALNLTSYGGLHVVMFENIRLSLFFKMKSIRSIALKISIFCIALPFILAACGPTNSQVAPQQTVTITSTFQSQVSPVPTIPTYRCGAWSSNNAPGAYATIIVYARLTKNIAGVGGAKATAVVHFQDGSQELDQHPLSDNGGYVSFTLPLQGRQPVKIPATIDVTFTNFPGGTLHCTPAFFTPM